MKQRPDIIIPGSMDIPLPASETLPNGVPLHVLDCSDQDVVRVSFVFRAGTSMQEVPFSASTTANMLAEGSARHTAQQIAERLDFYGSYYDVSLDRDYAVITFVSLSKYFAQTIEIAHEILLEPSFPQHEFEVYCGKRKQRLAVERSKVGYKSRELFAATLFGADHPYGISYPEDRYDRLTRKDLLDFYKARYTAGNCFVVGSGKIGGQEKQLIADLAAGIPKGGDVSRPVFPQAGGSRTAFEGHSGAVQSSVRIGRLLFPRSHPDYIAMQVVAMALGGYFGSRLVHNLREQHGYTYGVFAAMVNLEYSGYFAIATEVATEVTGDAVKQIYYEIAGMREELMGEEELQMVRNIMTGEVMRILDGPFGIADATIENIENGTDNRHLDSFLEQVRTITPEQVRDTARKYLDPSDCVTVVVGDPSLEAAFE